MEQMISPVDRKSKENSIPLRWFEATCRGIDSKQGRGKTTIGERIDFPPSLGKLSNAIIRI